MTGQILRKQFHNGLDIFAMTASFACLLHCLALPLLVASLPALSRTIDMTEALHVWILVFALPTSLYALYGGFKQTNRRLPLILGVIGLAALTGGLIFEDNASLSVIITVIGSVFLSAAHLLNWNSRHRHPPA